VKNDEEQTAHGAFEEETSCPLRWYCPIHAAGVALDGVPSLLVFELQANGRVTTALTAWMVAGILTPAFITFAVPRSALFCRRIAAISAAMPADIRLFQFVHLYRSYYVLLYSLVRRRLGSSDW
jgi:hypothetical protein